MASAYLAEWRPMSDDELRISLADSAMWSPDELKEQRLTLGLSERMVADTLLLSQAQVRGLETGVLTSFHNEGFYQRARTKYIALLTKTRDARRPSPSGGPPDGPHAMRLSLTDPSDL